MECTKLLLDAGIDPNQADDNGNTPLFLLLKFTFVKKSYIRYLYLIPMLEKVILFNMKVRSIFYALMTLYEK